MIKLVLKRSPFENINFIDVHCLFVPEERNDDRQTDRSLGSGNDHHEKDKHLSGRVPEELGKGDEGQIDGIQHQFNAHEYDDGIAADNHAEDSAGE
jgi:hypothetical protein